MGLKVVIGFKESVVGPRSSFWGLLVFGRPCKNEPPTASKASFFLSFGFEGSSFLTGTSTTGIMRAV